MKLNMKLNKNIFALSLGTAVLMAMVIVVGMTSVPKAPLAASPAGKSAPIILASLHPGETPAAAAQPQSIPVPCPIWILGQIVGYGKTPDQSADSAKSGPEMVPGGIWLMQKLSEAVRKTI